MNAFIHSHPIWSGVILMTLGALPVLLWPEVSDGSRGGDASGTGARNTVAEWFMLVMWGAGLLAMLGLLK